MKAADIKVGGVYLAKVSGTIARVQVMAVNSREGSKYIRGGTSYEVKNLRTGRTLHFRSAAKLRCEVKAN